MEMTTVTPLDEGEIEVRTKAASESSRSDLEHQASELRKQLREIEAVLGQSVKDGSFEDYFATSNVQILRERLPWLVGLLLLQSSAAIIMSGFEKLLDRHIVIAFFVPMIVGTGGNAGNQPGVMTTRALGIGDFDHTVLKRLMRREAALASCTGLLLAVLAFARVLLQYPGKMPEAAAIAITVFLMVNIAICIGVGFSIACQKSGADPANGAAPLLTTVADLIGITLLCGVSALVLGASR